MRKVIITLSIAIFTLASNITQSQNQAYFTSDPTLNPAGDEIVFVYENDLWKISTEGGTALRLTAMDGIESNPRFSPDGKWLAFSSTKNGNADVFKMPVAGGEITQLTFHDADDKVDSWSWDSQSINFTSNRYSITASYKVNANGGTPKKLFGDNYFNNVHHVVENPVEDSYYFTESWESSRFAHRKHYKGDHNPDIKYYNKGTNIYKELTSYRGKDMWPTIDKNGTLYFASDEGNDEYNLYVYIPSGKKQLTNLSTSIGRPQVNADGGKIVFTKDYQIHIYDTETGQVTKPNINIYSEENLLTNISYNVNGKITYFDISPDNKKIAFISRGRLFVSDIKGKFVRELKTNPKERVVEVQWLKDNKTILFIRSNKGWRNLFTIAADKPATEKQISFAEKTERLLSLSPKRDKAAYISGNNNINLVDLKSFKVETIIKDEFWFRGSNPKFSPDGKFIAFTAFRNFEPDVLVYNIAQKRLINITNTGVPENDPYWSPDGKYLYISANRYNAGFPRGEGEFKLYRIPLYRFTEKFKMDEYDNLFEKDKKKDTVINIKFELEGITDRWDNLYVRGGEQFSPNVFTEEGKTIVLFNSNHDSKYKLWKMVLDPFGETKTEKLHESGTGEVIKVKDSYYTISRGNLYTVNLTGNKLAKIKIDHNFNKNLNDEFVQMFYENWTAIAENFYDIDYHGVDWVAMRERYKAFLPFVQNRDNLRIMFNDMLGELNASHLGFSSNGDEEKTFYKQRTAETGIRFMNDNPYKVQDFVAKSPADILDNPIHPGDELIAVNGVSIDESKNRISYFTNPDRAEELKLTFKRGKETFEYKTHSISSGRLNALLYDEWIENNQKLVDKISEKKVAYVHMKDMGGGSLNRFLIDMTSEAVHRDALILDLRYNRGGNVHDDVIQFLAQKPYLEWQYRNGKRSPQPNFAPSGKPIVLLINEHSLSDAEMTTAAFKELGLGTVVGTETYRWIIFTSGRLLVDGSYTRLPAWGCYDLEGNNLEITGAAPDVYIKNTFKDRLEGNDPQLEKALEEVMKQLNK